MGREEQWRDPRTPPRPAASSRTTRKGSAISCRALRGASERHKPHPEGSRVRHQGQPKARSQTCNQNMGQGRTLERAKDNRRLTSSARTTRKPPWSNRAQRGATDRGSKLIQKEKVRSTNENRRARISGNLPTH